MVAFNINVAGVTARRGYPMWGQRGAPAFLAWVGAPWGNPSPAPGGNWSTGAPASRQGHPGSVPKRKALPLLEGRERETQARRPEAKDQGSPKTDRNNQPGKPGHSLRQGAALRDAGGG